MQVRRASSADAVALFPLYADFHTELAQLVPSEDAFRESLDRLLTRTDVHVYVDAGAGTQEFAGYACVRLLPERGEAVVEDLYVQPARRRRGSARALMEHVLAEGRRCGWRQVVLDTGVGNAPSNSLYLALGFVGLTSPSTPTRRYTLRLGASPASPP